MLKSIPIIAAVVLALVANRCNGLSADESAKLSKWRKLYDLMFQTGEVANELTTEDAHKVMDGLFSMTDFEDVLSPIPFEEQREVEYWINESKFEPKNCNPVYGRALEYYYRMKLPSPDANRPNLKVFMRYLNEAKLSYCARLHDEVLSKQIDAIPDKEIDLILSFKTDDEPPKVAPEKVAEYFGKHYSSNTDYNSFPSLRENTELVYARVLESSCKSISAIPTETRAVISYLYNETGDHLSPKTRNWYEADAICALFPRSLLDVALKARPVLKKLRQSS